MAPGLQLFSDIADDGTPRLDAASGEELVRVDRAVTVALGPRSPESPGTLFVTTRYELSDYGCNTSSDAYRFINCWLVQPGG